MHNCNTTHMYFPHMYTLCIKFNSYYMFTLYIYVYTHVLYIARPTARARKSNKLYYNLISNRVRCACTCAKTLKHAQIIYAKYI